MSSKWSGIISFGWRGNRAQPDTSYSKSAKTKEPANCDLIQMGDKFPDPQSSEPFVTLRRSSSQRDLSDWYHGEGM